MATSSTLNKKVTEKPTDFCKKILDWYDRHRRVLPWRALPNQIADPYQVWLSEIMLQQTTVQAVIPYFEKFLEKWPTVFNLANASHDEVMHAWAGLGYYARARNLHKCAKVICSEYDGTFPSTQEELLKLPGIGDYTSAAITSIAFNKHAIVADGNVERVMARYHALEEPLPKAKKTLKSLAAKYSAHTQRQGDYAQSLMDLGATICTPKSPACALCPINLKCEAYKLGDPTKYPVKANKKKRPVRFGYVYIIENEYGELIFEKRGATGLLAGMFGLPTSAWIEDKEQLSHIEFAYPKQSLEHEIKHVFTHFTLYLSLYKIKVPKSINKEIIENEVWVDSSNLSEFGIPTVFKKALKLYNE